MLKSVLLGAVAGYLVGGKRGALYGAALGAALGSKESGLGRLGRIKKKVLIEKELHTRPGYWRDAAQTWWEPEWSYMKCPDGYRETAHGRCLRIMTEMRQRHTDGIYDASSGYYVSGTGTGAQGATTQSAGIYAGAGNH